MDKRHVLRALGRNRSGQPVMFAGRFALDEVVAEGATGAVWKARDRAGGTPVALKFFATRLCTPTVFEARRNLLQALRQSRHPAVVPAEEIIVSGECTAIVMPWVDGECLARGHRGGARSIDEISPWFAAVLGALEEVHARGLVHGALHPGLIFPQGDDVRIVGWEANAWLRRLTAQAKGSKLRLEGKAYMSPALRRGEPPTAADDIYAVGAILHLLLTGSAPPLRQQDDEPVPVLRHRADIEERGADRDEVWQQAAQRCLQPAAADRFASVRALRLWLGLEDLTRVLADAGPLSPAPVEPEIVSEVEPQAEPAESAVEATEVHVPKIDEVEAREEPAAPSASPAEAVSRAPDPLPDAPSEPPPVSNAWIQPEAVPVGRQTEPATVVHASWARPAQLDPLSALPARPLPEMPSAIAVPVPRPHAPPAPGTAAEMPAPSARVAPARAASFEREPAGANVATVVSAPPPPPSLPRPARVPPPQAAPERPAAPSWRRDRPASSMRPSPPVASSVRPARVPVRGVFMLRAMLASVTLLTIASGGWLAWQIVEQRYPEFTDNAERVVRSTGAALLETIARYRREAQPSSRPGTASDAAATGVSSEFRYGAADAPPAGDMPLTAAVHPAGDAVRVQQPLLVMPATGSALGGGVFDLAHVDAPPRPVAAEGPMVSRDVLARATPGHVEVVVVIDSAGEVVSANARSASDNDLVEPCLDAARRWRFEPAMRGGRPVAVRATVPLAFRASHVSHAP